MHAPRTATNNRILIIDDNRSIHEDIRKILMGSEARNEALDGTKALLFGESLPQIVQTRFEVDSAYQGQEGLEMVKSSLESGQPYSLAFVDVRMPPGWDGVETIARIWKIYPELQIVICTAYADHSWEDMIRQIGKSDSLVILKKPFDNIEVLQLAHALSEKWVLTRQIKSRMDDLDLAVSQRTHELQLANEQLKIEVAERKKSEEAIRQTTQQLQAVFTALPDLFFLIDLEGTILDYRGGSQSDLYMPATEFMGKRIREFLPAEVSRLFEDAIAEIKVHGNMASFDYSLALPRGEQFFEARLVPLDADRVVILARNITARRSMEESNARLVAAIEQSNESVLVTDTSGIIQYVNPSFERITGHSRQEVVGKTPRLLKSGVHEREIYDELWGHLRTGKVWHHHMTNRRKDGVLYETETTITPVRDSGGHIINYVAVARDITYQRSIEEQLRQSQKMQAIGRLAGGVAHDFNNILTVIGGYCALLLDGTDDTSTRLGHVTEIQKSAERGAALTRQLLSFSRKQVINPKVISLNEVIVSMNKMLRRLIGENIELRTDLDERTDCINADTGQIEQVLMNLAVNARDAMPRGGQLVIKTTQSRLDRLHGTEPESFVPGDYVCVTISDSGTGMTDDVKAHLFEPFFTTKGIGKGVGLGLATCYGIIRQASGHITVFSTPGQGTSFKIYLPAVRETRAETAPATAKKPSGGHETILLVEDEDQLRKLAASILRRGGYTVLAACNGREGLELARQNQTRIQIVLTDLIMPVMGGMSMAAELKPVLPHIPVVFMSGYTDDALAEHGILDPDVFFLEKPFTPDQLVRKTREILDAHRR